MEPQAIFTFVPAEKSDAPHIAIAKWTLEDYHQMIAAGILSDRRVELLNGEIIEISPKENSTPTMSALLATI